MTVHLHRLFRPAVGAGLTVLCGVLLWGREEGAWVNASYDYLFRFCSGATSDRVVLIQMDNDSYGHYGQKRGESWDRSLHAELLNRLAQDGCRLVVFDTWFVGPTTDEKDEAFAQALERQRGVVLGRKSLERAEARFANPGVPDLDSASAPPLWPRFLKGTNTTWGFASLERDGDGIVRKHWPFLAPSDVMSLAWSAALAEGARPGDVPRERWLRYYNQTGGYALLNYRQASDQRPGYYTNKIVFIGSKPETSDPLPIGDDKFSTPYTRWTDAAVGGMEILATEFLNLVNGDWLRRPSPGIELGGLIAAGLLLGGTLGQMRPLRACLMAAAISALVSLSAILLTQVTNYWVPWLVLAGGQTPCALAWTLIAARLSARQTSVPITASPPVLLPESPPARIADSSDLPDSDDYEIFHLLGEGSFGKVWLARNAINQWQALKAVYLARFGSNTGPYEREFNGIRRYKPVSDKHPGLLRIDFISTKKPQGYFYYVMELADALDGGWEKNPASYRPKDLAKLLAGVENRRLPAPECVRIALFLAEAVDFLHRQSLTHGDIKPQNIIFVHNQPKLADVGLVKDLVGTQTHTGPCTPAFVAPGEAPGTVQADIYALGMVLYIMFMGRQPESFPAVATTLLSGASQSDFVPINSVILRACHPEAARRYPSAGALAEALRQIQSRQH